MKVILLNDVAKIGHKYDVKEVSGGYARNFLIPRGLAEAATPNAIKGLDKRKEAVQQEKAVKEDLLNKNISGLKDLKITIEEKANEKGHLFAAVHAEEISKILKEKNNIEIPAGLIDLGEEPIKELGEHKVLVHPSGEKTKDIEFILEVISKA